MTSFAARGRSDPSSWDAPQALHSPAGPDAGRLYPPRMRSHDPDQTLEQLLERVRAAFPAHPHVSAALLDTAPMTRANKRKALVLTHELLMRTATCGVSRGGIMGKILRTPVRAVKERPLFGQDGQMPPADGPFCRSPLNVDEICRPLFVPGLRFSKHALRISNSRSRPSARVCFAACDEGGGPLVRPLLAAWRRPGAEDRFVRRRAVPCRWYLPQKLPRVLVQQRSRPCRQRQSGSSTSSCCMSFAAGARSPRCRHSRENHAGLPCSGRNRSGPRRCARACFRRAQRGRRSPRITWF